MGIADKMANAKKTSWVSDGFTKAEVKTIVDLAKISAKLERCRLDLRMTQKEFAEYMGVSQGMVSKWESREYNFTIKSLNEICEKLNIDLQIHMEKACPQNDYKVIKWNEEKFMHKKCRMDWVKCVQYEEAIA